MGLETVKVAAAILMAGLALAGHAQVPPPPGDAARIGTERSWLAERKARFASLEARQARERRAETDAKNVVVMVGANLSGESVFGAGIIVGRRDDTVFVITANHVVRRGDVVATDLQLRFRRQPARNRPAVVVPVFDPSLDVAVLAVADPDGEMDVCGPDFRVLSIEGLDRFGPGGSATPVGNPNGRAWLVVLGSDAVMEEVGPERLTYQSMLQSPGHSGGALLAEGRRLVGMVVSDAPPFGSAVNVNRLLQLARSWGVPVQLRKRWRLRAELSPAFYEGAFYEHELAALLVRAVRSNDLATAKRVVSEHCDPGELMELRRGEASLLHVAAYNGSLEMTKLLLGGGARIGTTQYARNETPLQVAAAAGHLEVVRVLLEAGADPGHKNSRGMTALDLAPANSPVAALLRGRVAKKSE